MKSWTEKLNDPRPHEVKVAPKRFADINEGEMMLLPTAKLVDAYIRALPEGVTSDLKTMRHKLAQAHGADKSCPVVTGIHLRTVAEAAFEALERGIPMDEITPVWRVLDDQSTTIKKLSPANVNIIRQQRTAEHL